MSDAPPLVMRDIVRAYLERHQAVYNLLLRLRTTDKKYLTDEESQDLGIEYSALDFDSGKTSEAAFSYFLPTSREEYDMTKTDVEFDEFRWYPDSWMKKTGKARGWCEALVATYLEFADDIWEKVKPTNIRPAKGNTGEMVIYRDNYETSFQAGSYFLEERKSYRVIVVVSYTEVDEDRLTVSETEMILSWMNSAMNIQTAAMRRNGVPKSSLHMIFPVLMISFSMPTHARIIQGYYDNGKLKIQLTKLQNFQGSKDEYKQVMNMFLKWGDPVPQGDTILEDRFRTTAPKTKKKSDEATVETGTIPRFTLPERPRQMSPERSSRAASNPSDTEDIENWGPEALHASNSEDDEKKEESGFYQFTE